MPRVPMSKINVLPLLKQTAAEWSEDKATKMAASLAFYTATSIAPLAIAVVGIITLVVHKKVDPAVLHKKLEGFAGKDIADVLQTAIDKAANGHSGLIASILGIVIAMVSASVVFGELQDSLNTIWEVRPKPDRGIKGLIQDRFLSMSMVAGVAFLLLVSTVVTGVVTGLSGSFFGVLGFGDAGVTKTIVGIITFFLTTGVVTVLFAAIFKVLPDVEIAWRDVWLGGFLTAVMFQVGKLGLSYYIDYATPGSAFGAFGSVVVMLVWVDYSAWIFFFGAEFTQVYANQYGSHVVPSANAEPLTEDMRRQAGIPHAADSASHPDNLSPKPASAAPRRGFRPLPSAYRPVPSSAGKTAVFAAVPVAVGVVLGRLAYLRLKGTHGHRPEDVKSTWAAAAHQWKKLAKLFVSNHGDRYAMTHGPAGRAGPAWADMAHAAEDKA